MIQNVKLNPPPLAQQTRQLVSIQPNIGGNSQFSMDSTVQAYISTMQPYISLAYKFDDASVVLSYLIEAFMRRETFLFAHVIQDSMGNNIYFPDWSTIVEAPGHRDFIKNSLTVTQDDFASFDSSNNQSVFSPSSSSYAPSETSMRSWSRSWSPSSVSDSGEPYVDYNALEDPRLTNGTSEEKKNIVREFGENLFAGKLICKPNLLRGCSKNHDCVIKFVGKPSSYKKMLEFFQNPKAFDLNQVINAAVVQGEGGVIYILEFKSPESLKDAEISLDAELAKNTQSVELGAFKVLGPLYNYSKLAYEISQYIKAILLFKDGEEILKQTMGKFNALNLAEQTWGGIEDAFENKNASSVAERYSKEGLMKMSDLSRRLSFLYKLIVEKGYGLRQIQAERKDVFALSHLHAMIPHFKTCLKFDPRKEKRDKDILDCDKEIKEHKGKPGKERHVAHKRAKRKNLIDEGKNREEKAKEKSKDFIEKNGLAGYKVLYEEDETDKSYSAFDKAICEKGMDEIERVYHIFMEVIEKINHDQSVTQSNTEKKKNVSSQSGKRPTKAQKGSSKPRRRKNNRGYSGRKTNKSQSKYNAKRY